MSDTDLKPMTVSELAARWNVSRKTVLKWIRPFRAELGTVHGRIFTVQQVRIILDRLE